MYRKELFYRGLAQLPIYIEDTLQNSPYYFNIVEIPKVFGPGKNSIRFNLNENNLDIYNDVDVEIIDSYGNTVYHETPEYFQSDEENIRVLTVYLYSNISNGPLQITFIGHAKTGINGEEIPDEFKNKYNVRYTTTVDFNRFQKNTSRILFATSPSISITEARTSYVSRSLSPLNTVTVSGSGIYRYQQSYPLLELPLGKSFTNDMLNGTLILTGSSILPDFNGYTTSSFNIFNSRVSNIYNSQVAILTTPWTASISGVGPTPTFGLINNADVNYTLTYNPTPNYTPINNFKSFINLKISNLDPASGYLKYIKLYGKSQGSLDQYELIGESLTEDSELLINSSSYTQFDRSNVGYFLNTSSFQSFWNYNNTYLSASFNTSSLFNSLYLEPLVDTTLNNVLFTSNIDINFQKGSSYRLYINYVKDTNFILEVYMSGSAFIDKTGNGQRVFYLDSTNFGPSYLNLPIDFLAPQTGTGRLQFKIVTGSFYISDISLKSGVDQGFNPSNFNSYFPINVKNRNDVYDFKVDFIDDNNQINSYEFDNTGAINIQVSGSNQYISGNDNLLPGRLNLGESLNGGISLNGNTNTISTHGYTSGSGWIFWSGSQSISGSSQPGSGFYFETGAPYNHYIKAAVGGQVQISGSIEGATGGTTIDTGSFVTTSSFNSYTSSVKPAIDSISGKANLTGSNLFTGRQSIIGDVYISSSVTNTSSLFIVPPPQSASGVGIWISGSNTKGGSNYVDFLQVTNATNSATNPNKFFRVNNTGEFQIISNDYNTASFSLTDSGTLTLYGSVTMPNRPAFRVVGTGPRISSTTTISGSAVSVEYNLGNAYNQTTGKFTAPIAGLYQVNVVCRTADNNNSGINQIIVRKRVSGSESTSAQIMLEWASNTSVNHMGGSTISSLGVGDTLWVDVTQGTIAFDLNDNFSAAYIG